MSSVDLLILWGEGASSLCCNDTIIEASFLRSVFPSTVRGSPGNLRCFQQISGHMAIDGDSFGNARRHLLPCQARDEI
jgi:hypothetical protein